MAATALGQLCWLGCDPGNALGEPRALPRRKPRFVAFGGFASLVVASFGGSRRDKIFAHFGLAVTGSIGLIIGTAISGIEWLAVLVTIPVAFGIFFAGVARPNMASGVSGALFGYVLPVATPGTVSMIPDRLAGWWLVSVVATAAVLLLSPPSPADRLHEAAAGSARALAAQLEASVNGTATTADREAGRKARNELMTAFASTPYRPTGLATADQGSPALSSCSSGAPPAPRLVRSPAAREDGRTAGGCAFRRDRRHGQAC